MNTSQKSSLITMLFFSFLLYVPMHAHNRYEQRFVSDESSSPYESSILNRALFSNSTTKLIKDMDYEEAFEAKKYYELIGDKELAIKCLERMLLTDKDAYTLKVARLDLATAYELEGKYEKALKLYEEFSQLYPGSVECEQALYKSIKINYILTPDFMHDQTKTLKTIDLADQFLDEENKFIEYKNNVEDIRCKSYAKLCDHNIYICEQYLNQFAYSHEENDLSAARHRLEFAKKEYLPYANAKAYEFSTLDSRIQALESVYCKNKQLTDTEDETNDETAAKKPDFTSHF